MDDRVKTSLNNQKKGYNCCQAVACAYCDLIGMDEGTMFKVSEGFGLGMGNQEGTCGAVSGAIILAGLKSSSGDPSNPITKKATHKLSKEITDEFSAKNGSIICKELKGVETRQVLRTCAGCIQDASEIIGRILKN